MVPQKSFLHFFWAISIAAIGVLAATMSFAGKSIEAQSQEERDVPYTRIGGDEYQSFIGNWDQTKNPVLYALLQTSTQYAALFHPAPVMGKARPFGPSPSAFELKQILVVSRVTPASDDKDKVFEVERLTEKNGVLTLSYRFKEPRAGASYTVKNSLCLGIAKRAYGKVRFYEDGKLRGELNTAAGQWSVPAVP